MCDPDSGQVLDRVTAVKYQAPRSYTGEDMVEVTTHGGAAVPSAALGALVRAGGRMALPGEFTERAVLAGKLDLLSAEAVNALVSASEEDDLRQAVMSSQGAQSRAVAGLAGELRELQSGLEAGIEFDSPGALDARGARERIARIGERLSREQAMWERRSRGEAAVEVVIAGVSNAGKSTLFNLVVGEERALVDREAGTTRDYLVEQIRVRRQRVRLVDTAGLGWEGGGVTARGMARSWDRIERAAGVVWVSPMDSPELTREERELVARAEGRLAVVVMSKQDKGVEGERAGVVAHLGVPSVAGCLVDARDGARVSGFVRGALADLAERAVEAALVGNSRQEQVIREVVRTADEVAGQGGGDEATVGAGVARMLAQLELLSGSAVGQEGLLERVFRTFCVGK